MGDESRIQAQRQWNKTACGEVEGNKESVEYFSRVEHERYNLQRWMNSYFDFGQHAAKKVLEIGVGQGTDLLQFGKAGAECYGADITDNHLSLTRRNFELRSMRAWLTKADAAKLPFPDNSFDCVYSFGVLHHILNAEAAVGEVYRVLKPGGKVMIAVYNRWSAFHAYWLLYRGICSGWLVTKGYSGLLSTIEKGADGIHIKPYVKLYTKRTMRGLLSSFSIEDVSVHQLELGRFRGLVRIPAQWIRKLEPSLGWYIACRARKV